MVISEDNMVKEFFLTDWLATGDKCHIDHIFDIAKETGYKRFADLFHIPLNDFYRQAWHDKELLALIVYAKATDIVLYKIGSTWHATRKDKKNA